MFVLERNRYYRYYITNLYYQHSKTWSSVKQFCVMIVCTQVTSAKYWIIFERGRIVRGTRQLLHGWSTTFGWICFKHLDKALKTIGLNISMVQETRNLFLGANSGWGCIFGSLYPFSTKCCSFFFKKCDKIHYQIHLFFYYKIRHFIKKWCTLQ